MFVFLLGTRTDYETPIFPESLSKFAVINSYSVYLYPVFFFYFCGEIIKRIPYVLMAYPS